jgi:DNA repair protein RecO (recombination protein O)
MTDGFFIFARLRGMEYRYTGIMLRKREVGETDRLYTFLSRESGKITAIGKGVRKSEAKLASSLETAVLSEIIVARSRGLGKITGAVLEESFPRLHADYTALAAVSTFLVDLDRLVEPDESDRALFDLVRTYLGMVENWATEGNDDKIRFVTEAAYQQCFVLFGYRLELVRCAASGERLAPGGRYAVSLDAGGIIALSTAAPPPRDAFPVSENAVKYLRLFVTQPLEKLVRVPVTASALAELSRFRAYYVRWIRR